MKPAKPALGEEQIGACPESKLLLPRYSHTRDPADLRDRHDHDSYHDHDSCHSSHFPTLKTVSALAGEPRDDSPIHPATMTAATRAGTRCRIVTARELTAACMHRESPQQCARLPGRCRDDRHMRDETRAREHANDRVGSLRVGVPRRD